MRNVDGIMFDFYPRDCHIYSFLTLFLQPTHSNFSSCVHPARGLESERSPSSPNLFRLRLYKQTKVYTCSITTIAVTKEDMVKLTTEMIYMQITPALRV